MARVDKKIPFKGKINGMIYYEYRGLACVRSMPRNVSAPHTPGQVAQQERIAAVAIFYQALKEVGIYTYWRKAAEGRVQTGYNLLVQANLQAFDGEGNICDFSKLRITPETLPLPECLSLEAGESGTWRASWQHSVPHPGASDDDRLVIALMEGNAANYDVKLPKVGTFRRGDGEAVFRLPDKYQGYEKIYLFFKNGDACKSSRTLLFNIKKSISWP